MRYFSRRGRLLKAYSESTGPTRRPWHGPGGGVMGVSVPMDAVLVRSPGALVTLQRFVAYPEGVLFELGVRRKEPKLVPWGGVEASGSGQRSRFGRPSNPALRFEVEFSDGRRATSLGLDRVTEEPEQEERQDPVLRVLRGSGSPSSVYLDYWLWPLPPAGPLQFIVDGSGMGIENGRVTVDGSVLGEAASRSEMVWQEADGVGFQAGGVGWVSG